jgi:hypothetical protein
VPELAPWMWFVLFLFGMFCATIITLMILQGKRDLANMESEMPKLPPIPNRDDRIMSTVQEAFHDHQDGVQRS